jgi:hypothetical protein
MRVFKVILGFFLLLGVAEEYLAVSRQFGKPFDIILLVITILFVFACTWLMGSGFTKEKLVIKSIRFLVFFILTSLLFVMIIFVKVASRQPPRDIAEVNGIKIPIGRCIEGCVNMIPDVKERKVYCTCLAEKLSGEQEVLEDYKHDLEAGNLEKVISAVKAKPIAIILDFESCFSGSNVQ